MLADNNLGEVIEDTEMDMRKEIYEWKDITSEFFDSVSFHKIILLPFLFTGSIVNRWKSLN